MSTGKRNRVIDYKKMDIYFFIVTIYKYVVERICTKLTTKHIRVGSPGLGVNPKSL